MKLVIGLGNPGQKYKGTRHNIGFDVVAFLAERYGCGRPKAKFNAEIGEISINNEKTVLLSPLTFMNLSGQSIRAAVDFYKLELDDLIVVCDDLALDAGRIRVKASGSAGGQKGLADTINRLGSNRFARLRIGIGKPPAHWDTADFVLGQFSSEEKLQMDLAIARAAAAIEVWVDSGVQETMNQFNADPNQIKKEKLNEENVKNKSGDRQPSVAKTDPGSAKSNLDGNHSTDN